MPHNLPFRPFRTKISPIVARLRFSRTLKEYVMFVPIMISWATGLVVALATGLILSPKKTSRLPGGSVGSGLMVAMIFGGGLPLVVACAIAGLIGWLVVVILMSCIPTDALRLADFLTVSPHQKSEEVEKRGSKNCRYCNCYIGDKSICPQCGGPNPAQQGG